MFTTVAIAILLGFFLIAIASASAPRKSQELETPIDDDLLTRLNALPINQFSELMSDLMARIGLLVEEVGFSDAPLGGVDILANNTRELMGGRFIVHIVRCPANQLVPRTVVRRLYQAVREEEAMKGVLIATGFFSDEAIRGAQERPIELANGDQLRNLLNKHLSEEVDSLSQPPTFYPKRT